jgi:antirestriction protein ArdC
MGNAQALYERITADFIEAIEANEPGQWKMPWKRLSRGLPKSMSTGKAYNGINRWILSMTAAERGWTSGQWATYKQWEALGHQVQKGERGTEIFLWKPSTRKDKATGEETKSLYATTFKVHAREQTDAPELEVVPLPQHERLAHAEDFFAAIGADCRFGGDQAAYMVSTDRIICPELDQFDDPEHYYATLAHEHTHWTGHPTRLDRQLRNRFGDDAYAAEELIAEIGAAFVCAQLDIDQATRTDHHSYVAAWLRVLRADVKAIATAASQAQKAADWLNEYSTIDPALESV